MGRHKQPREVAEFKGAHKKDPQRYRDESPKNLIELGDPPPHMYDEAKAIWFELSAYAIPNVLTVADRFTFEIACNLLAEYRESPILFPTARLPQLISLLARFGLSPADRQKLRIDDSKKPSNKFSEFN